MPNIKLQIKEEHKGTQVFFGKSGLPLGQRDDLVDLAIMAQESGDKSLLNMFESMPTLEKLRRAKTDADLKKYRQAETSSGESVYEGAPDKNPAFEGTDESEKDSKQPSQGVSDSI